MRTPQSAVQIWLQWYADTHCTLCGNSGVIDTRGVRTPAGVLVGRLNWCVCPNGILLRKGNPDVLPTEVVLKAVRGARWE